MGREVQVRSTIGVGIPEEHEVGAFYVRKTDLRRDVVEGAVSRVVQESAAAIGFGGPRVRQAVAIVVAPEQDLGVVLGLRGGAGGEAYGYREAKRESRHDWSSVAEAARSRRSEGPAQSRRALHHGIPGIASWRAAGFPARTAAALAVRPRMAKMGPLMSLDPSHATVLLQRINAGDEGAASELLPLLYDELRRMAGEWMCRERRNHTLQPTALVHEAWMRVLGGGDARSFNGAEHFLRLAARAMRNVLVDHARSHGAHKRNDGAPALALDEALDAFEERALDVVELDDALERLTHVDEQLGRLVELRFFAGLTIAETAEALGTSTATVERSWRVARLWLRRELPGPLG